MGPGTSSVGMETTSGENTHPGPTWIAEALAAQEEHIKRSRSCMGRVGRPHVFRDFGRPASAGAPASRWRECAACGVTEASNDYAVKVTVAGVLPPRSALKPA